MLSDKNNENVFQSRCNVFCTLMAGLDGLNGLDGLDGLDVLRLAALDVAQWSTLFVPVGLHRRFLCPTLFIFIVIIFIYLYLAT